MDSPNSVRLPSRMVILVFVLTLVGGILRFRGLAARDFWFDESCTFICVQRLFDRPPEAILHAPYYLVLRIWTGLWGDSEAAYRSLSAVAATLTVPVLAWVGGKMRGLSGAGVCGVIAAFHPLHIYYAHEARAYALWVLFLSVACLCLWNAVRGGRLRSWVAFAFALWVSVHLHAFTLGWMPPTSVAIVAASDRRRAARRWLYTMGVVGLTSIPYLARALSSSRSGVSNWLPDAANPIGSLLRTLWAFLPSGAYPSHLTGLSTTDPVGWQTTLAQWLPLAIIMSLATLLVLSTLHRKCSGENRGIDHPGRGARRTTVSQSWRSHAFAGSLTLIPLLIALGHAGVGRSPYLVGRYDMVAWPGAVLWMSLIVVDAARRFGSRRSWLLAMPVLLILVVCGSEPIHRFLAYDPGPSTARLRAERLAAECATGDVTIALNYDGDSLLYYLHRSGFAGQLISYPSWLDDQIGWVDAGADLAGPRNQELKPDALATADRITRTLRKGGQAYLLTDSVDPEGIGPSARMNEVLMDVLAAAGLRADSVDRRLGIYQLVRRLPPSAPDPTRPIKKDSSM